MTSGVENLFSFASGQAPQKNTLYTAANLPSKSARTARDIMKPVHRAHPNKAVRNPGKEGADAAVCQKTLSGTNMMSPGSTSGSGTSVEP
jgi:hypothetical protein